MNIRTKLAFQFTTLVATILGAFCMGVYSLSEDYRQEEFFSRLESRGITTARLFVTVKEVDKNLLRIIDRNSIHALFLEHVQVFDQRDSLVYASLDEPSDALPRTLLNEIRQKGKIQFAQDSTENVGLTFRSKEGDYVVISSAFDRYGRSKLENLRYLLFMGFGIGILLIVVSGYIFAGQALQPLVRVNEEIANIGESNLSSRINEGNGRDEIAQLGKNFNNMLIRLETAFEMQQQFVSSASHELRNPLASITSQLQMMLEKRRTEVEYEQSLQSLLEDTQTLVALTNGLLLLAQSDIDKQRLLFTQVRVDEVLFTAQNELRKAHPDYHFLFEYHEFPDDEAALSIQGNEHLLKIAFLNLMDNACKFSPDQTVQIRMRTEYQNIYISFQNQGGGIAPEEQELIFTPFFRGKHATSSIPGHGIGLALCQRIVQFHKGQISLDSAVGKGSRFTIQLPIV